MGSLIGGNQLRGQPNWELNGILRSHLASSRRPLLLTSECSLSSLSLIRPEGEAQHVQSYKRIRQRL